MVGEIGVRPDKIPEKRLDIYGGREGKRLIGSSRYQLYLFMFLHTPAPAVTLCQKITITAGKKQ